MSSAVLPFLPFPPLTKRHPSFCLLLRGESPKFRKPSLLLILPILIPFSPVLFVSILPRVVASAAVKMGNFGLVSLALLSLQALFVRGQEAAVSTD